METRFSDKESLFYLLNMVSQDIVESSFFTSLSMIWSPFLYFDTFNQTSLGTNLQEQGEGWSHLVQTLTPGIPGDSGSGFFDGKGGAFGTLSTLTLAPVPGLNGVGDLAKELEYMRSFDDFKNIQLALGTEDFSVRLPDVGLLGVDLGVIRLWASVSTDYWFLDLWYCTVM